MFFHFWDRCTSLGMLHLKNSCPVCLQELTKSELTLAFKLINGVAYCETLMRLWKGIKDRCHDEFFVVKNHAAINLGYRNGIPIWITGWNVHHICWIWCLIVTIHLINFPRVSIQVLCHHTLWFFYTPPFLLL